MNIDEFFKEVNIVSLSDIDKGYSIRKTKIKKNKKIIRESKVQNDYNPFDSQKMKELTTSISKLASVNNIKYLSKWKDIDLTRLVDKKDYDNWELEDILSALKSEINQQNSSRLDKKQIAEYRKSEEDNKEIYIDSLEIIKKYKNGDPYVKRNEVTKSYTIENSQWHPLISQNIKIKIKNWANENIDIFYNRAKKLLIVEPRNNDLIILISKLSELIYERDTINTQAQEIEQIILLEADENSLADIILFRVESIIKPHIEVIEKNIISGGRLIFADMWNIQFKESLKNEVRERDGHKCLVCESEVDLHIHHKIPRNLGGVHHLDNLVTLCASCHGVIEQVDVQKSFNKGLSNYKKNLIKGSLDIEIPLSKININLKIEEKLDNLLNKLDKRNQDLITEVVELMAYFEKLKEF
ncbi:HNH endonuclease [Paenibacillus nicotianae]|uniref:HNH endonuclease n=1 Tax=Paenibacillus nicotianae TaxID=1526551 RepID=A0ABW4UWH7_9BACL